MPPPFLQLPTSSSQSSRSVPRRPPKRKVRGDHGRGRPKRQSRPSRHGISIPATWNILDTAAINTAMLSMRHALLALEAVSLHNMECSHLSSSGVSSDSDDREETSDVKHSKVSSSGSRRTFSSSAPTPKKEKLEVATTSAALIKYPRDSQKESGSSDEPSDEESSSSSDDEVDDSDDHTKGDDTEKLMKTIRSSFRVLTETISPVLLARRATALDHAAIQMQIQETFNTVQEVLRLRPPHPKRTNDTTE